MDTTLQATTKISMKIALLLTGQLRTSELVRPMHYHRLVAPYAVDVFMSIDPDNSRQNEFENERATTSQQNVEEAVAFYKPVRHVVNRQTEQEMVASSWAPEEKQRLLADFPYAALVLRQYFVVQQAYKLLADHVRETGAQYDLIMRLRFDQLLFMNGHEIHPLLERSSRVICEPNTIQLSNELATILPPLRFDTPLPLEPLQLHVFGYGPYLHYHYVNDQFWYHSPALSQVMASFYDALPRLTASRLAADNRNTGAFIESLLHEYLLEQGVEPVRTSIGGVFVRGL